VAYGAMRVAVWPVIIVLSPVILVAGEPANRYVERWRRPYRTVPVAQEAVSGSDSRWQPAQLSPHVFLIFAIMSNPLWIALTAPGRWVGDRFTSPARRAG
jgi:hypothetical protein